MTHKVEILIESWPLKSTFWLKLWPRSQYHVASLVCRNPLKNSGFGSVTSSTPLFVFVCFTVGTLSCYVYYFKITNTQNSKAKPIVRNKVLFPYCMLLFENSNGFSTQLETAVTWSKSHLNNYNEYLWGKVPSFSRYMRFSRIQKPTHNEKSIH